MNTQTLFALTLLSALPVSAQAAPATAAPATAAPAAQAVTLRYKFAPGQVTYYLLTVDTDGTMTNPVTQAPMPLKNHIQTLLHQTVKSVRASDGAATVDTGLDTLSFAMNGQTFPVPPEKLAAMKTVGTTLILPTGKVLSFTPAALGGGAIPGMDFGRANALSILGVLPDAPLRVGDSWKSDTSAGLTGSRVSSGFSLTGVSAADGKTAAVITQTTDGSLDAASSPGGAGAMGMNVGGRVKGAGTIRFDVAAGALESLTNSADMILTMTPPGATAGMTIGLKITTSMKRTDAPVSARQ